MKYIRIHIYEYIERMFASNLPYRDRKPKYISTFFKKTWRWWQAMAPHPSLRLGLLAPQLSRRHHAQSLLGPSFHDPRKHNVLESHPERAAPLSYHDDERWHAIGSHSALALRLYLAACNPPQVVAFESWTISAPICLNRFTFAESRKFDLWTCVCVLLFPLLSLLFW